MLYIIFSCIIHLILSSVTFTGLLILMGEEDCSNSGDPYEGGIGGGDPHDPCEDGIGGGDLGKPYGEGVSGGDPGDPHEDGVGGGDPGDPKDDQDSVSLFESAAVVG